MSIADRATERSVLDELEALDIVEAHELQEASAFHAFQFKISDILGL